MENVKQYIERLPKDENIVGSEMESFALFYIAQLLNKNAACLLTVVDSNVKKQNLQKSRFFCVLYPRGTDKVKETLFFEVRKMLLNRESLSIRQGIYG